MTLLGIIAIVALVIAFGIGIADEFDLDLSLEIPLWRNPTAKVIEISDKKCLCIETTKEKFEQFQKDQDGFFTDEDIKPGFIIAESTSEKDVYAYFEVLKILEK